MLSERRQLPASINDANGATNPARKNTHIWLVCSSISYMCTVDKVELFSPGNACVVGKFLMGL